MNAWQKICLTLVMAFFAGLTGTAFAAVAAPSAALPEGAIFSAADAPSQSQDAPPDCKRKPDDPRCKNKPY